MIQPYLNSVGIICRLGNHQDQVLDALLQSTSSCPTLSDKFSSGHAVPIANIESDLPDIPFEFNDYNTRTNQLLLAALEQIKPAVDNAIQHYGRQRIAVIIGTSTSGIAEGEAAINHHHQYNKLPKIFNYKQQEIASTAEFIAKLLATSGPSYALSTSCSSSSSAICSAQRLLNSGLCDAVIVGGSDALCQTTIQGFDSLGAISKNKCNPFSQNRDGIVIGEGAALFLMTRDAALNQQPNPIRLLGTGTSSDAYHISAPEPSGRGASLAMKRALSNAKISDDQIDYINLHGTGTPHNDSMESQAVHAIFTKQVVCSSTKPLTGHCLGASGAIELALCWLLVSSRNQFTQLPIHIWDQQFDPKLAQLNLVNKSQQSARKLATIMSNTYSFGGNNVSLIIGRQQ